MITREKLELRRLYEFRSKNFTKVPIRFLAYCKYVVCNLFNTDCKII